jgi:hypothetical protein
MHIKQYNSTHVIMKTQDLEGSNPSISRFKNYQDFWIDRLYPHRNNTGENQDKKHMYDFVALKSLSIEGTLQH